MGNEISQPDTKSKVPKSKVPKSKVIEKLQNNKIDNTKLITNLTNKITTLETKLNKLRVVCQVDVKNQLNNDIDFQKQSKKIQNFYLERNQKDLELYQLKQIINNLNLNIEADQMVKLNKLKIEGEQLDDQILKNERKQVYNNQKSVNKNNIILVLKVFIIFLFIIFFIILVKKQIG